VRILRHWTRACIANMNVLLVEPDYYTRYPSLGLLKIGAFHKQKGDDVLLVRGRRPVEFTPDRIYVTSLFTWDWKPVWEAVRHYKKEFPRTELRLGGIYASLLADHAKQSGADTVWEGILPPVEDVLPDYSLVPEWKSSLLFATRGCPRKCGFCSVPKLEGAPVPSHDSIGSLMYPGHTKAVFFDNNILALPNWRDVFIELIELQMKCDFNQGMDARLINEENAALLGKMDIPFIRMAFDYIGIRPYIEKAITRLKDNGIKGRRMVFYVLHNYVDDPEDFFQRVRDLLSWGVVVYPMRYEPLCTLQKHKYVSPKWTPEELRMVAEARRVLGYGGAFPPYKGLVEKFQRANKFQEAFSLRPIGGNWKIPGPVVEMALEHEQQSSINKNYFPTWRREKDWRKTPLVTSSLGR